MKTIKEVEYEEKIKELKEKQKDTEYQMEIAYEIINKQKEVIDKIKEKCDLNKVEYTDKDGNEISYSKVDKKDILELLEEIE